MLLAATSVAEFFDKVEGAAELEAAQYRAGENFEDLHLFGREGARRAINHAQTAKAESVAAQRHAAVEADVGIPGDQRILGKARVFFRIRDDERFGMLHRVCAEGCVARSFGGVDADARFEPLATFIDKRNECDRCSADERCGARNVVELFLSGGVENAVGAKKLEPIFFVGGSE